MKISAQILVTATTLCGLAAAAPEGYIQPFSLPECAEVDNDTQFALPVNVCVNLEPFVSFEAGFDTGCAKGETPMVTVYSEEDCIGSSVNSGPLPASHDPGVCNESLGRSAMFVCIA